LNKIYIYHKLTA